MQALRAASAAMTWEALGSATIYASAEPCPMCAAAIYWCNIRRLVFCVSEPTMRALREPYERAAGIAMRCDEIFDRCSVVSKSLAHCWRKKVSKFISCFGRMRAPTFSPMGSE